MGYEIARGTENKHTSPVSFPALPPMSPPMISHVWKGMMRNKLRPSKREERGKKGGANLGCFLIINTGRKKELEDMTKFSRNAAPTMISVVVACQQCH